MPYSCLLTQSTRPAVFISSVCFRHLRKEKRDTEQQKVVPTARPQLEHSFSVGISSTTHKTRNTPDRYRTTGSPQVKMALNNAHLCSVNFLYEGNCVILRLVAAAPLCLS
jgi:hypothetical protein